MKTYKFIRTGEQWFIDLPEYIKQGGNYGDLQMVDGADPMLEIMAGEGNAVTLTIGTEHFAGADELVLTEKCDPFIGGGYYLMKTHRGKEINHSMWLCQVTEFVFGNLPERIFVRQENK